MKLIKYICQHNDNQLPKVNGQHNLLQKLHGFDCENICDYSDTLFILGFDLFIIKVV
jgi:hypothetical protein